MRPKIGKKLGTASLNSNFTGLQKKECNLFIRFVEIKVWLSVNDQLLLKDKLGLATLKLTPTGTA